MAGKPKDSSTQSSASGLTIIGRRQQRLDGFEKVSGRSVFTDDVRLPGMLHGKIVRSPHARARIVSIDTSAASPAGCPGGRYRSGCS